MMWSWAAVAVNVLMWQLEVRGGQGGQHQYRRGRCLGTTVWDREDSQQKSSNNNNNWSDLHIFLSWGPNWPLTLTHQLTFPIKTHTGLRFLRLIAPLHLFLVAEVKFKGEVKGLENVVHCCWSSSLFFWTISLVLRGHRNILWTMDGQVRPQQREENGGSTGDSVKDWSS